MSELKLLRELSAITSNADVTLTSDFLPPGEQKGKLAFPPPTPPSPPQCPRLRPSPSRSKRRATGSPSAACPPRTNGPASSPARLAAAAWLRVLPRWRGAAFPSARDEDEVK